MKRRSSGCWLGTLGVAILPLLACDNAHPPRPGPAGRPDQARASAIAARFPGAGTGGASLPIIAGTPVVMCEEPGPAPGGTTGPAPGATATRECYFDADHPDDPAAIMEWVVESASEGELVHARLTFNPRFVDNTYGENAIGWGASAMMPAPAMMPMAGMPIPGMPKPGMKPKPGPGGGGHTFKDLVGSDHAEFTLTDANGAVKLKFKADYLSESTSAPSGYASLGVTGGEGKMLVGSADAVVAVSTSLDRNLNTCGYESYLVDSPDTDDDYSVNQTAPKWDYRVVYDVWVERSAFAGAGFGRASVEFVHASPSKAGTNTIDVKTGDCPPGWPPYCKTPDCVVEPPRCGDDPDENCDPLPPPCTGESCPADDDVPTAI